MLLQKGGKFKLTIPLKKSLQKVGQSVADGKNLKMKVLPKKVLYANFCQNIFEMSIFDFLSLELNIYYKNSNFESCYFAFLSSPKHSF